MPLAQMFKMHLDNALSNMLYVWVSPEMFRHLDLMIFGGTFHLNYSIPFHSIFIIQTEQSKSNGRVCLYYNHLCLLSYVIIVRG